MNIVTGANGFLGAYICKLLVKNNKKVNAFVRKNSNIKLLNALKDKIKITTIDYADDELLLENFKAARHIYHIAGKVSYNPKEHKEIWETNVELTKRIANIAIEAKVEKLLYASSIAALGKNGNGDLISETNDFEENKYTSFYGKSKHEGEMEIWRAAAEGLPVLILNPSVILGSGNWNQSSLRIFEKVNDGLKYFPSGGNGFVDVRDVAKIAIELMDSSIANERFLINGGNHKFKQIFDWIADGLHKPAPEKPASKFAIQLVWKLDWLRSKLTGKAPLLTKETVQTAQNISKYNNTKIKEAINFTFTSIEKTISDSCKIFLQKDIKLLDFND